MMWINTYDWSTEVEAYPSLQGWDGCVDILVKVELERQSQMDVDESNVRKVVGFGEWLDRSSLGLKPPLR
jgi:hypothetical protein